MKNRHAWTYINLLRNGYTLFMPIRDTSLMKFDMYLATDHMTSKTYGNGENRKLLPVQTMSQVRATSD